MNGPVEPFPNPPPNYFGGGELYGPPPPEVKTRIPKRRTPEIRGVISTTVPKSDRNTASRRSDKGRCSHKAHVKGLRGFAVWPGRTLG